MSTPATETLTVGVQEWRDIAWPEVEREVHTLQRRIYRASKQGDTKRVHRLQRLLMSSRSAKYLAVRRVTQDNQGKRTAGVDGIASLEPAERIALAESLSLDAKPKPTRRVWIPKPGTDEQRPLGIPTMHDRAAQSLVKLALEPEWEARFEPNSYGFRPGRSCQDAIEEIFTCIRLRPCYVLDADIAKCFDRINHEALLAKLNTIPPFRRAIKAWLKAGVLDGETLFPTEEGTPQGGVISPLLANIALHGLEKTIQAKFPRNRRIGGRKAPCRRWRPHVIRYADDFVVLHPDLDVVRQCQTIAQEWLKGMGLELKPSKTRLTHTLHEHESHAGFDFLGFTVRQFPVGETHARVHTEEGQGIKTIIKPSKAKVKAHWHKLADLIKGMRGQSQERLIKVLNPVIHGWSNYYRHVVSKRTFSKVDDVLFHALRSWALFRHKHRNRQWVFAKYWRLPNWVFGTPEGLKLRKHAQTPIRRHVKVRGDKSPFDGDWTYWASRQGHYPGVSPWVAWILRRQQGRCAKCGLYFVPGDLIEVHHVDGDRTHNKFKNLGALHRHCHDKVHGQRPMEVIKLGEGVVDKDWLTEEPGEAKVSSPVLKASTPGD